MGYGEDGPDGLLPTDKAVYVRVYVKNQEPRMHLCLQ